VEASDIVDFEVCMYSTEAATLGGAREDFIFSGRLDNLMSCFCGLQGLLDIAASADDLPNTLVLGMFDNEEVGSASVPGAGSTLLGDVLRRVVVHTRGADDAPAESLLPVALRKSLLVSADMAHAAHPNYPAKHDRNHRPRMNKGPVIKANVNERYATTAVTASAVRKAAAAVEVPVQDFVIRQDIGCGSTIGPILSTSLGIRTVDIGIAQLSMHSAREMCGSKDVILCIRLLRQLYQSWHLLDAELTETD
jgi:aspartyl aminopeptidase